METYFVYEDVINEPGSFYETDVDYPALMKKHITKHGSCLQPIFEAFSNSFEATKDENDEIAVLMNFSHLLMGKRKILSISVFDSGHGIKKEDLVRMKRLFDDSKGKNNFGSGRIQYLHYFKRTDIHTIYKEGRKVFRRRLVMSMDFYKDNHSVLWIGEPVEVDKNTKTGTTFTFSLLRDEKDELEYNELTSDKLKDLIWKHYLGRLCMHAPHCQIIRFEEYIAGIHNKEADRVISNADIPNEEFQTSFKVNYTKYNDKGNFIKLSKTEKFELRGFKFPITIQKANEVKVISKGEVAGNSGLKFPLITSASKVDDCFRLFLLSSPYLTKKDTDKRGQLDLKNLDDLKKSRNLYDLEPIDIVMEDIEDHTTQCISKHYISIQKHKEYTESKLQEIIERYGFDEKAVKALIKDTSVSSLTIFKEVFSKQADDKAKSYDELNRVYDSLIELDPSDDDFLKQLKSKVNKVSSLVPELNKRELLDYTSKRRVVMLLIGDILKKRLLIQRNNAKGKKYSDNSETLLHKVIFPKKSEDPLNSNLWIINEDYIHYEGISETEIEKLKLNGEFIIRDDLTNEEKASLNDFRKQLKKRPDILLFPRERKCVIIELKSLSVDITTYITQPVG